jgi:hypothetical protein
MGDVECCGGFGTVVTKRYMPRRKRTVAERMHADEAFGFRTCRIVAFVSQYCYPEMRAESFSATCTPRTL